MTQIDRTRSRERALARVLPPKLRRLVPVLAQNIDAPIQIPPGRAEPPENAAHLRVACERLLDPEDRLDDPETAFLRRSLTRIDPVAAPWVRYADPQGLALAVGQPVAMSATSFAVGSYVLHEPRVGFPEVGQVASITASGVLVEPYSLPNPAPRVQSVAAPSSSTEEPYALLHPVEPKDEPD